ncbi:MAG: hypothetical protein JW869_03125 [Candidatus Omnitrophica bacterium]|nr:hypothetical protein [Candidatus Omnitrophota bacterium]
MPALNIWQKDNLQISHSGDVIRDIRLKLVVDDKRLLPAWKDEAETDIFFPEVCTEQLKGDVLAHFRLKDKSWPAVVLRGEKVFLNFDPFKTVDYLINEKYFDIKKPFLSYLPCHYHFVPGYLRFRILRYIVSLNKNKIEKDIFPNWYIEGTVEFLRALLLNLQYITKGQELAHMPFWPENKKFALCLTHDVDSMEGFKNIETFARLESEQGVASAFNIVFHNKKNGGLLADLGREGFEIGLHGDNHDAKLAFLKEAVIEKRLSRCLSFIDEFSIKGFRSPFLLKTQGLFNVLDKFFQYDSSVPDTEFVPGIINPRGCCCVFPYRIGRLLEIPITVPQDGVLLAMGYSEEEILSIWQKKLSWLKKVGGLAVVNTHPERYFSGNEDMLGIYRELLRSIKDDRDCWIALPRDVAAHWKKREDCEDYTAGKM